MGEYKKRKNKEICRQEEIERKSAKRKMRLNSRLIEDYDRIKEEDIVESDKKKEKKSIRCRDQECEEKRNKRKRWKIITTSKSEAALKKKKRRRTTTEDIRVFFGTEDSH